MPSFSQNLIFPAINLCKLVFVNKTNSDNSQNLGSGVGQRSTYVFKYHFRNTVEVSVTQVISICQYLCKQAEIKLSFLARLVNSFNSALKFWGVCRIYIIRLQILVIISTTGNRCVQSLCTIMGNVCKFIYQMLDKGQSDSLSITAKQLARHFLLFFPNSPL